jgi:hypothetical protein
MDTSLKKMTKENGINAILLTAGVAFTGEGINLLQSNLLLAVLAVVVGLAIFAVREMLP